MMQRDSELDHTKACAEMAAGDGDRLDHHLPDLARELFQLMVWERAQIGGRADAVKQGRGILGGAHLSAFSGRAQRINALKQL
jgi:hypothetical protein